MKKFILFYLIPCFLIILPIMLWILYLSGNRPTLAVKNSVDDAFYWVNEMLINEKMCDTVQNCNNKEYLFYEATKYKIYLNFYTIKDKTIIEKICTHFNNLSLKNGIVYSISFYEYPHSEYVKIIGTNSKTRKKEYLYSFTTKRSHNVDRY